MDTSRVALITGAGSGIGRASARVLARCGWRVILAGRSQSRLDQVAREIGTGAHVVACDLSDATAIDALVTQVADITANLDAVVNCAAQTVPATLAATNWASAEALWRVNVLGPLHLTQQCQRLLAASARNAGTPVVVNITTSIGQRGWPGSGVYAATKAALESLTRTWAIELASQGIRVVAIAPGAVETPMATSNGASPEQVAALRQWQRDHTPLGRVAQPEEIAETVAFVCTSATFITGAVIPVDGGAIIA